MTEKAYEFKDSAGLFRKRYADVHDEQFGQAETSQSGENPLPYLVGSILNPEEPSAVAAVERYTLARS